VSENKTQPTDVDPRAVVAAVEHPVRRADAEVLLDLMHRVTGWQPRMWGPSIIGYGSYRYRYDSGREGEAPATGFSPRKANLVLYVVSGYDDLAEELAALGKYRLGKSCLYINRLADVDLQVLERIVQRGLATLCDSYEVTPS
jgi:hypothetical protein